MLYQTHHPHFFRFHAFTSIPLSATATNTISLLSSSTIQGMECVEAALKTSLRKEMTLKSSPQALPDDLCAVNYQNVSACEDDFVDDFLDFSNDDGFVEQQEPQVEEEEKKRSIDVSEKQEQQLEEHDLNQSINYDDFGPIPAGELAVPADDVENLEWLSHFVEDSFSEYSAPFPAGTLPVKPKENDCEPETPALASPCFKTPVPAKARSKRTRTGGRVWSLGSPSLSDSSTSSTSSSYSSCPSSPWLIYTNPGSISSFEPEEPIDKAKKQKKKSVTNMVAVVGGSCGAQLPRRCSHCGVQKTPQWRTGPLGAKTLCNACGVRYKSGRLLPEYRPACSPTFSSELHSNHHRKVLEMRRKKEMLGQAEPGLAPPVVPSF